MLPYHTKITKYFFIIFLVVVLLYGLYEARNIIVGPVINISAPESGFSVTSSLVEISGSAGNIIELSLDGRKLLVNESGEFTEELLLAPGENTFIFEAKDKFGRTSRETLKIFYKVKK